MNKSKSSIYVDGSEIHTISDCINSDILNRTPVFEKVPLEQFIHDWGELNPDFNHYEHEVSERLIREVYDNIQIPKRSTSGSAGYDFIAPMDINIKARTYLDIPTGIRCKMPSNQFLMIVPRSGLGFKHRIHLANTVGIIDSDYYNAKNYGHIIIRLIYGFDPSYKTILMVDEKDNTKISYDSTCISDSYNSNNYITIPKGKGYVQGIFMNYNITSNEILSKDDANFKIREGGFGSTDNT